MVKVIMHGCLGKMGQTITRLIAEDDEVEIAAGVDIGKGEGCPYPVFTSMKDCNVEADVVIDFASAKGVDMLLETCVSRKLPCVLCTTGLSKEQLLKVEEASKKTAILKSANMSLGVNMLCKLIQDAVKTLVPAGFDMEIIEKHHNQKIDAPSGTALALADAMNEVLHGEYEYCYDRSAQREPRPKKEIGILAVRGGTIVGEHDVIFAGTDEVVTFSHKAYSKAIFGKGAIEAAKYLKGKPSGLYTMRDVMKVEDEHA